MKFYVITDDENGMKITWKNVSGRFSHSEALSTCGLSVGTFLTPIFIRTLDRSRCEARSAHRTQAMPTASSCTLSFLLCAPHFLSPPFHSHLLGSREHLPPPFNLSFNKQPASYLLWLHGRKEEENFVFLSFLRVYF